MSKSIEFETQLTGGHTLELPPDIASALPPNGKATVVVIVEMDPEDASWQKGAYEQFLSDDKPSRPEDQIGWREFIEKTYGSCADLGLEEPEDLPLQEREWPV